MSHTISSDSSDAADLKLIVCSYDGFLKYKL